MKTITIIALVVLCVALAAAIALWLTPTKLVVESTTQIKAPRSLVYNKVARLSQFHTWSPWLQEDPQQKHFITGTDGAVGSAYHWQGVKEESVGQQILKATVQDQLAQFDCKIVAPFSSEPVFTYAFKDLENSDLTEVTVRFELETGVPFNVISKLIGLKGHIETSNAAALKNLRGVCESEAVASMLVK